MTTDDYREVVDEPRNPDPFILAAHVSAQQYTGPRMYVGTATDREIAAHVDGWAAARDHLAAQEPTDADPTPLQERIRRARSVPADWAKLRDGETTMEQIERHQERMNEQTAALIAAEVRKAQADAWEKGKGDGLRQADYEYGARNFYAATNPYREQEN